MKKLVMGMMLVGLLLLGTTGFCDWPGHVVGMQLDGALAQSLIQDYGPTQRLGTDNKHGFLYFRGGDFTLTILIHDQTIVRIDAGRWIP